MRLRLLITLALLAALSGSAKSLWEFFGGSSDRAWTPPETETIRSLALDRLPPLPPDPGNAVADDPRAVRLGHRLFFDERLSANGEVSCASCHQPERLFTDGRPLAETIGTARRHTLSIVGSAYDSWFFWDGRADSQWSQALVPLEDPVEQGGTRTAHARTVARHYRRDFEALFGPLPDLADRRRFPVSAGPAGDERERAAWEAMSEADRDAVNRVFAGIGKALAAYERRIRHGRSRFDRYAAALSRDDADGMGQALSDEELEGLRLFIGEANCIQCHNGPRFTNGEFHSIGLPPEPSVPFDVGRKRGVDEVLRGAFNCLSPYSDAGGEDCQELRFVKRTGIELIGAFKVPGLRNVAETAPYMHRGQLATLEQVVEHYDRAPQPLLGHADLEPLGLSAKQRAQLVAFLRSLSAPLDADPALLSPPDAAEPLVTRLATRGD